MGPMTQAATPSRLTKRFRVPVLLETEGTVGIVFEIRLLAKRPNNVNERREYCKAGEEFTNGFFTNHELAPRVFLWNETAIVQIISTLRYMDGEDSTNINLVAGHVIEVWHVSFKL
jgi:hypothetical protein